MKKRKVLAMVMAGALLLGGGIFGTYAYLTADDKVQNTFTVGKVSMVLDEAKVNEDGEKMPEEARVKENSYKIYPGFKYDKDPTVTMGADIDPAYLFVQIEVEHGTALETAIANHKDVNPGQNNALDLLEGFARDSWTAIGDGVTGSDGTTRTYTFSYNQPVEANNKIKVFDKVDIPAAFTTEEMNSLEGMKINVKAFACQKKGFNDQLTAWNAVFKK